MVPCQPLQAHISSLVTTHHQLPPITSANPIDARLPWCWMEPGNTLICRIKHSDLGPKRCIVFPTAVLKAHLSAFRRTLSNRAHYLGLVCAISLCPDD